MSAVVHLTPRSAMFTQLLLVAIALVAVAQAAATTCNCTGCKGVTSTVCKACALHDACHLAHCLPGAGRQVPGNPEVL